MKRAIYVDYENVSLHGLEAIEQLGGDDSVKIFIGTQSTRLSMEDADRIFNCKAKVELITNKYIGKNALDFIIMVYMGYDIAKGLANAYFVVSNDKGYDPAIYQMRKLSGLTVQRKSDISFVLKEKIAEPEGDVDEKNEESEKKKGLGRRFLGLFGIGKEKEEAVTEEEIEEVATETVVIGKDDSEVRDKVLNELVGENKKENGRYRGNGRYRNNNRNNNNNNAYGRGKRQNYRQDNKQAEIKQEKQAEVKQEKQADNKPVKQAEKEPEKKKQQQNNKNYRNRGGRNNKNKPLVIMDEQPPVKLPENKPEKKSEPKDNKPSVQENTGRRKVTRKVTGKKQPQEHVKTPEEIEREKQRDEAFAILKELNED